MYTNWYRTFLQALIKFTQHNSCLRLSFPYKFLVTTYKFTFFFFSLKSKLCLDLPDNFVSVIFKLLVSSSYPNRSFNTNAGQYNCKSLWEHDSMLFQNSMHSRPAQALQYLYLCSMYYVHCTYYYEREYCECIFGRARVGTISFIFYSQLLITDYHCTDDNKCIQFNEHSDADLRQVDT